MHYLKLTKSRIAHYFPNREFDFTYYEALFVKLLEQCLDQIAEIDGQMYLNGKYILNWWGMRNVGKPEIFEYSENFDAFMRRASFSVLTNQLHTHYYSKFIPSLEIEESRDHLARIMYNSSSHKMMAHHVAANVIVRIATKGFQSDFSGYFYGSPERAIEQVLSNEESRITREMQRIFSHENVYQEGDERFPRYTLSRFEKYLKNKTDRLRFERIREFDKMCLIVQLEFTNHFDLERRASHLKQLLSNSRYF